MKVFGKLLIITVLLNIIRYLFGMPIENWLIMEPMHAMMPNYPDVFDFDFTTQDIVVSLGYNFLLWFSVVLIFHFSHRSIDGSIFVKSLKGFALGFLLFVSLAAVYMNHYNDEIKVFYLYSMIDAIILFSILGAVNGIVYPWFFKNKI